MNSYTFHITLYDLFFTGMIFTGLNFAGLLALVKSVNRTANRILALALVVMVLWMIRILAIDIRLENYLPGWNRLPIEFLLALGPLIHFYVLKITRPHYKFVWKNLWHFSPLLLELDIQLLEIKLLNPLLQLLIFISIISYLYRSHRLIQNFYGRLQPVLMDRSLLEFRWLRRLLAATALLWLLWITYAAVDYFGYRNQLGIQVYYPFCIVFAVIIIWTAAAAFLRPQAGLTVKTIAAPRSSPQVELREKGIWLKKAMDADLYYQDPELSLSSLAEKLNLTTHELSRIINIALKKNFNDFINEYRIRDVAAKMQDPAYERITLVGMAFDAGFNSKATFIRAFKQLTGKNPAEYKRELEKEVASYRLQPRSHARQIILVPEVPVWSHQQLNYQFMFRNYLKIAWRNVLRNKFYALINIIGLTVGLTFGLLILLWVNDEFSFDTFNTKADRIYKINAQIGTGTSRQTWGGIPGPIAMHAVKDVPEVENSVRINPYGYPVYRYKEKLLSAGDHGAYVVDASFFKVFDFRLLKGNINNPFPDIHSIIITETTAKRFFGDDDPIGKVLLGNSKDNYTVSGVMADFPENSSFKADILFSFELAKKNYQGNAYWKSLEQDWGDYFYSTYVLLKPGTSAKIAADKLTAIHIANQKSAAQAKLEYVAEPLLHLHLYNTDGAPAGLQTARIFLIVAVLILIIACINYVNLSTARAMLRSKEVSVRKIIGAERRQLFGQFIIETTLYFFVAVLFSLIAVKSLMPAYNTISGKEMQFNLFDAGIWKVITLTVIGSLAASSIYPALLLSSFKPINALKGKLSLGVGNVLFRKGLVVTQFIFSIVLIIGTLIIRQQLKYIQEKDLGYDKSHVFGVDMGDIYGHYDAVRAELMSQSGIVDVTRAGDNIVNINGSTGDTDWDGKDSKLDFLISELKIGHTYINFFKLKIVAGRQFHEGKADSASFILNETAAREAGIKDPIGKRFTLHRTRGTIVGVVKDFHFASLKQKIEPAILVYAPQDCATIFIKTTGNGAPEAIKAAEKAYKQYNPIVPYSYQFLDADYDNLSKSDTRSGTLFSIFACIAIFISCLGLLGLATYTAQVKVKEIGIRKVLGASVTNITSMLSVDFLKLVLLSIVIATPIAWYAMHKWLQDYAYPVKMHWWVFALAGVSALLIAFITISFQAVKAALANPVKSLRSE
ncbi:MAG TPA: ABC transporter permease [Mucilaginibacter sp.]|nr:ABC transporter permease [Mucilaginibacter sp.]